MRLRKSDLIVGIVVSALLIAGVALVTTSTDRVTTVEPAISDGSTTSTTPVETAPQRKSTAELLTEGFAASPGLSETCGEAAVQLGRDVFDAPDRLMDAVAMADLACRTDVIAGMAIAGSEETFSPEQIDTVRSVCENDLTAEGAPAPCGMIVATISTGVAPESAFARCAKLTGPAVGYIPSQRLVCSATYLSLLLNVAAVDIAEEALRVCSAQPAATEKICVESLGMPLLTLTETPSTPVTTIERTIKALTTLPTAIESCRTLGGLSEVCQRSVVDAMALLYPLGAPSSPARRELCWAFDEPVRTDCINRESKPDSFFTTPG